MSVVVFHSHLWRFSSAGLVPAASLPAFESRDGSFKSFNNEQTKFELVKAVKLAERSFEI
jgi:hypothetical protein